MKRLLLAALAVAAFAAPGASASRVLAVHFGMDVNPVTQDWLTSELDRAQNDGYDAAVIVLDTPGGLQESMRKIVQKELSLRDTGDRLRLSEGRTRRVRRRLDLGSRRPARDGFRDQHRLVHPDQRKRRQHRFRPEAQGDQRRGGVAAIAGAQPRPQRAVGGPRRTQGLEPDRDRGVEAERRSTCWRRICRPCSTRPRATRRTGPGRSFTLHLGGAAITDTRPGFFTRFLSALIDPNIIGLLFLAGLAGLGYEIFHPGVVLPGALGAVALLTALFGFSVLPLSWAGLGLVLLGAGLLVVDTMVTTHGALTVAGLIAMAVGLLTLFHNAPAPYHTSVWPVIALTVVIGGAWAIAIRKAVAVRRTPVAVGPEEIVGMQGVVREGGLVFVHGELWRVRSPEPLAAGQRVEVDALDGLTLRVHPI